MEKSTKILLGLGALGVAGATYVFYPKKAKASEVPSPKSPPGEEPPKGKGYTPPPLAFPSWLAAPPAWWTAPTTPPKGLPTDWVPPKDWVPPWVTAEAKSKDPGVASDEYKAGFNDGFKDAAYSSDWGTSQNKTLYASSASYKNGYDNGWAEYSKSVKTGAEFLGKPKYVRVGGGRLVPAERVPGHMGAIMMTSTSLPVARRKLGGMKGPDRERDEWNAGYRDGGYWCNRWWDTPGSLYGYTRKQRQTQAQSQFVVRELRDKSGAYQRGFYVAMEECNNKRAKGSKWESNAYEMGRMLAYEKTKAGNEFTFELVHGGDIKVSMYSSSWSGNELEAARLRRSVKQDVDFLRGCCDGIREAGGGDGCLKALAWWGLGAPTYLRVGADPEHIQEMGVLRKPYVAMPAPTLKDKPGEFTVAVFKTPFRWAQGLISGLVAGALR